MDLTNLESKGIIYFDLETTGVDTANDRIVQIALIKHEKSGEIEEKNVLVNPTIPIPEEATEVHKITNEMVANCPPFSKIAKSFYEYMQGYDIGGFNILGFDMPLLVEEFLRAGVIVDFSNVKFIDVMNLYRQVQPRDLAACYKLYTGKEIEGAHDALNDTRATVDAFMNMLKKEDDLKELSYDELCKFSQYDKEIIDYSGKFTRDEAGVIVFNFSKHKGEPAATNRGFLNWMIKQDFTQDTKQWVQKLLDGQAV